MQLNDKIKLRATQSHPTRSLGDVYEVTAIQAASDVYQSHATFHVETGERLASAVNAKRRYKRRDMRATD